VQHDDRVGVGARHGGDQGVAVAPEGQVVPVARVVGYGEVAFAGGCGREDDGDAGVGGGGGGCGEVPCRQCQLFLFFFLLNRGMGAVSGAGPLSWGPPRDTGAL
jgi:hypothetical protein